MYSVDEALERLLAQPARRPEVERISIDRADGRITAEPVIATVSVPPADNSAMDGYAVRCADVRQTPSVLPVSMRLAAGDARGSLMAGTACRIFTGAELPDGADAVVIQEHCVPGPDSTVTINTRPQPGDHIRTRGQDFAAGSTVVAAGFRLRPQEIGLIASAGHETVSVYRRLRVAVITTGDELVEPGNPLERGQIYNSNRFLVSALLRRFGAEVTARPPVRDDADATRQALGEAVQHSDLIVSCGGVSVGEEDHVRAAVEELGELDLWRVAIKPGKPFAFGHVGDTPFIGLPGNPSSALVTLLILVRPWLLLSQGANHSMLTLVPVPTIAAFSRRGGERREYLRARRDGGRVTIESNQSSGVLSTASHSDGFVLQERGRTIEPGDPVEFLPWSAFW